VGDYNTERAGRQHVTHHMWYCTEKPCLSHTCLWGRIIRCQTKEQDTTKWTDGGLVTNCLEQKIKSIVQKTRII
jgi:hypothetical protein